MVIWRSLLLWELGPLFVFKLALHLVSIRILNAALSKVAVQTSTVAKSGCSIEQHEVILCIGNQSITLMAGC